MVSFEFSNGWAMSRAAWWGCGVLLAAAMVSPGWARAKSCGDDVEGQRVACSCGDNVVSDTVLWATDPVVSEPCPGDGLVLLVPPQSEGITLNLGGQSLVGRGRGAGIRVVRGGSLGSVLVGGDAEDPRAEIARFATGIRANGSNVLREVRGIDVHDNVGDGLYLHSSGARLEDVRVERNGRTGASISGHGNEIAGVVAGSNLRDGLHVRGSGASVEAETTGNRRHGAVIGGRGNRVAGGRSQGNGGVGLVATGNGHELVGVELSGNAAGDLLDREGESK
jgi:hypothetical protein